MEEKIKVYVDSNEKDFITDCYLADNTKIICEFYHEESEIEYSDCKLLNLQEYDKQKDQRIAELEQELAGLKIKVNNRNKKIENQRKEIINLQKHIIKLKSCGIIPKFKVGQEVWHIITAKPMRDFIVRNDMHQYELGISKFGVYEDFLFATEQEAQAKLKEIQGNE